MDLKSIANELQPRSMAARDWVFQVIRAAIVRGVLPGGMPLRQDEISAALSVSHIPVREAFRQLEAQGLVRIYPNRGAVVTKLTQQEMEDIMDVRTMLEVGALRQAIPVMTEETFNTAEAIIRQAMEETDSIVLEELNSRLHFTLYAPANNQYLCQLIDQMHGNIDRYIRAYYQDPVHHDISRQQHRDLLEACKKRDVEAACKILHDHLNDTKVLVEPGMSE